jgi:hypothetical protein
VKLGLKGSQAVLDRQALLPLRRQGKAAAAQEKSGGGEDGRPQRPFEWDDLGSNTKGEGSLLATD